MFLGCAGSRQCEHLTGHVMTDNNICHFKIHVHLRCINLDHWGNKGCQGKRRKISTYLFIFLLSLHVKVVCVFCSLCLQFL